MCQAALCRIVAAKAICTLEGYAIGPPGRTAFTPLALATLKLFTPASQGATVAAGVSPIRAVFPATDSAAQAWQSPLDPSEKQRYNPIMALGNTTKTPENLC